MDLQISTQIGNMFAAECNISRDKRLISIVITFFYLCIYFGSRADRHDRKRSKYRRPRHDGFYFHSWISSQRFSNNEWDVTIEKTNVWTSRKGINSSHD